jgi:hypothetical protein
MVVNKQKNQFFSKNSILVRGNDGAIKFGITGKWIDQQVVNNFLKFTNIMWYITGLFLILGAQALITIASALINVGFNKIAAPIVVVAFIMAIVGAILAFSYEAPDPPFLLYAISSNSNVKQKTTHISLNSVISRICRKFPLLRLITQRMLQL